MVMVGLPARGKTYIANRVVRYLQFFHGAPAKVFNVGNYRRQISGAKCSAGFFDPNNKEAAEAERKREEAEHKNVLLEKVRQNFVNEKCANLESIECSKSKRTSLIHLECFNPTHQNKLWSVLHNFWCRWSYWQTCLSMMNSLKGMPKCLGYARTH